MQPILKINLTTGESESFTIPVDWVRDYLGGASLAARILYDSLSSDLDPLSPDAPLLFLTGPLTGTSGPAVGRFVVCARSPATGLWGESNIGGFWGSELRKAGYDGLWVEGCARQPVYLWIEDDQAEVRDAVHLWGLETYQTQEMIIQELAIKSKPRVAVIGPAGESQIPFASILTDHGRMAGRTGMGAVMGSKNLKAVALRGSGYIPVASAIYTKLRSESNRILRNDNFSNTAREIGSAAIADYADYLGEMPKRYYQDGVFDGVDKVSGSTMTETILTGVSACHACVIACGRVVVLPDDASEAPKKRKGPEYETIAGFGPNLLIDDLDFITIMGELCDRYGMDTISLSNIIGLAFTLFDQGIIDVSDTGGLTLQWGDKQMVEELVHMTVRREGFGAYLAKGSLELGRQFDAAELAVQINGLEVAYHDPRGASGMALVYATSPRGACHNQSDYFLVDIFGHVEDDLGMEYFERLAGAEKSRNVSIHQDWRTVFNSLVMCLFANVPPETVLELVNAATGEEYSLEELLRVGERAWNLKRMINRRFGLVRANDSLPKLLREPYQDGGAEGYVIPLEEMLEAYYSARGWDSETGMPGVPKLNELNLGWVERSGD
ncbi:MAG: aldehyde ferredoxin oxidoreductase family protein [Anaerolineales bacterium]|nr:aldehyde ferredoxin oxidoreductase family protein [Chloroflexota bacterium]MBL6983126.1 aldehyde ferredoxin oxidoreductase family protein [Anaerolineales bacterium]